jgi:hypothetical protein
MNAAIAMMTGIGTTREEKMSHWSQRCASFIEALDKSGAIDRLYR